MATRTGDNVWAEVRAHARRLAATGEPLQTLSAEVPNLITGVGIDTIVRRSRNQRTPGGDSTVKASDVMSVWNKLVADGAVSGGTTLRVADALLARLIRGIDFEQSPSSRLVLRDPDLANTPWMPTGNGPGEPWGYDDTPLAISAACQRILELQASWSRDNTPSMEQRGVLVRRHCARLVRELLPGVAPADRQLAVEGGDGTGLKTRVPWIRVYDPKFSPSATIGWYAAYLFAADGSRAYLTLGRGSTVTAGGSFKARPAKEIEAQVGWAATLVGHAVGEDPRLTRQIMLGDAGLGAGYERATVCAYEYSRDAVPDDAVLAADLRRILGLLEGIYEQLPPPEATSDTTAKSSRPPLSDVSAFIEWMRARYGGELVPSRRDAEAAAREMLTTTAGTMTEAQAIELGRRFNSGSWGGVPYFNRFSPAFAGATMHRLVDPIDSFNSWTTRIWRADEATALDLVAQILADPTVFPGAGRSYPTMLMYLRDPEKFAVWLTMTEQGLEALGAFSPPSGRMPPIERYLGYCEAVQRFMSHYGLAPQEVDAILAEAARAANDEKKAIASVPDESFEPAAQAVVAEHVTLADVARETYLDVDVLEEWVQLLQNPRKRQAIFYGPPGTGKSWVATRLARHLAGDGGRVTTVQFHPSFSYEDFIEGLRPVIDGQASGSSGLRYEVRPGLFLQACREAAKSNLPHVVVLDEMNRADLGSVLGELMMLLEYRGPENKLPLPYSQREFYVPENLIVLATMNTADRSLALVDFALRRRFHAIHMAPRRDVLVKYLARREATDDLALRFFDLVQERVESEDFAPGQSYWMLGDLSATALYRVWQYELRPYLAEYWFEHHSRLDQLEADVTKLINEQA